jgi:tetratricopeptide (TPR) repeat protein
MKFLLVPLVVLCSVTSAFADYQELVKKGDVHDAKFEFDEALKYYLPAEQIKPKDVDLLVKISRQYALRMSDLPKKADKIASCRKGLAYAERAVMSAPQHGDAHLCVAICLGKLTPFLGAGDKIDTSRKIKTSADQAVKLDPKNDYAWHVLGRWHQLLANINGGTRTLARIAYGGLPAASNDEAVKCFQKAMALNPRHLVHVIELGRTYALMGRKAEAKKYIEMGLAMPNTQKDDAETKARGRATLKEIS